MRTLRLAAAAAAFLVIGPGGAPAQPPRGQSTFPAPVEADYVARNFTFGTGETLPELTLHYRTIGTPQRDASGVVRNAVLILHGTGGSGSGFLSPSFGGQLFGAGQLLDATRYFIVLPDGIGHGQSSKPSDGMRTRFPQYTYDDMVRGHHLLLTEGLRVNHLRLVLGTSMGAMHCWVWGEMYPDFADGLVPLASAPTEIAGRNRVMRKMIIDSIRSDPAWKNGDYTEPPVQGLRGAINILMMMTSSPLQWHKQYPTRDAADQWYENQIKSRVASTDANDMIYHFNASRDYDPSPNLEKITAPVLAINSADDVVNPPELGLMEKLMPRVKRGTYILIPTSDQTRGHGTHSLPAIWGTYLAAFLRETMTANNVAFSGSIPFGYTDERRIIGDLTAAGFAAHTIETVDLTGSTSPESAAGLTQGNPSVAAIRERASASLDEVTGAVAGALAQEFGPGAIRIPMRAHASRPIHDPQPRLAPWPVQRSTNRTSA